MDVTRIFFKNQNRKRPYWMYQSLLCINKKDLNDNSKILVIGGGTGIYHHQSNYSITNIDLAPPSKKEVKNQDHIESIRSDFVQYKFAPDYFDEIWALYSLPLYCADCESTEMFFWKSAYCLKPGGKIRIFPATPELLDRSIIMRTVPELSVYATFYECMEIFAKTGGQSEMIWGPMRDNFNISREFKEIPEPHVNLNLWLERYKKIKHFIDDASETDCCAIISKPVNAAKEINQTAEQNIASLEKLKTNQKILVYSENGSLVY